METIAIIYLVLFAIGKIYGVFRIGDEQGVYTATEWLTTLIVWVPLVWLLWQVSFN